MKLVHVGRPITELLAVKVADLLLVAGRWIHGRYAVIPAREVDPTLERLESWRVHLMAFVTHAAPLAFSRNKVLAAGIVSRPAYDIYMGLLRKMGVVHVYPKSGVIWNAKWDKRRFLVMMRRRLVEAPYPLTSEPPRVLGTRVQESLQSKPTQRSQLGTAVFARDVEGQRGRGQK